MKKWLLLFAAFAQAVAISAERTVVHARFGADAFNSAVPAETRGNAVFSPYSFEIGCIALSDAFDSITKAHFAETIGVLSDFAEVYGEIMGRMRGAVSNRFSILTARALCLPDVRMASVPYRRELQSLFSIEVCPGRPAKGAECWLKSAMEGDMEDFDIPLGVVGSDTYAAYDLVSVRFSWQEPFPVSNTRKVYFHQADGNRTVVDAICDVRNMDMWKNRRFSMVRLPLADGAWFFALLPAEGLSIGDIRAELSSGKVDDLLSVMNSVSVSGVTHGPVVIVMPKMDITSDIDLVDTFAHFKFPLRGFHRMDDKMRPGAVRQRMRFRLDEQGLDAEALTEKSPENIVNADASTQKFILVRPFLFFVYHEPTGTIPVAGQFTGM